MAAPELRQEVLKLRRRVQKLTALLRLALALLRTSGFRLAATCSLPRLYSVSLGTCKSSRRLA